MCIYFSHKQVFITERQNKGVIGQYQVKYFRLLTRILSVILYQFNSLWII